MTPEDAGMVRTLVDEVRACVGERPVLVLGSRALGTAAPDSDLDAYVVVPAWRLPWAMRRLRRAGCSLERELGIAVSLNPLPAGRLRRARGAMLPFKLRQEAVVACSPDGWQLGPPGSPPVDTAARRSYAMTGILCLLSAGDAVLAGAENLDPAATRLVEKALLHAAQLELARGGRWSSTLCEAAAVAGGRWPRLAEASSSTSTWLRAREALVAVASEHRESVPEALARTLQWMTFRAVRGAPALASLHVSSPADALARAACVLAESIGPGRVDPDGVRRAYATVPAALRRRTAADWLALRELLASEWPLASPLAGL